MLQNKTRYIGLLITLCVSNLVLAGTANTNPKSINPLISYRCDTAADIILITNSLLSKKEAQTFQFNDDKGTYNPWALVKIDHTTNKTSPINNSKIIKQCTLSTGVYTTTIEPKIFSREVSRRCGTSISGVITVEFDGFEIYEKRAFEDYCHGNAPIITRITVFGRTAETKVKRIPKYKFY